VVEERVSAETPLTDEELESIEAWIKRGRWHGLPFAASETEMLLRLAAEVRRLRAAAVEDPAVEDGRSELCRLASDPWLEDAVEEIGQLEVREGYVDLAKALAILRKHRDGKA
jgi:hypothetical protein